MNKKMVAAGIAIVCVGVLIGFLIGRGSGQNVSPAGAENISQSQQVSGDAGENGAGNNDRAQNTDSGQNAGNSDSGNAADTAPSLYANHNFTLDTGNLTA